MVEFRLKGKARTWSKWTNRGSIAWRVVNLEKTMWKDDEVAQAPQQDDTPAGLRFHDAANDGTVMTLFNIRSKNPRFRVSTNMPKFIARSSQKTDLITGKLWDADGKRNSSSRYPPLENP